MGGSEALARVGPTELTEGSTPSDLDLLAPAPPAEETLPLPPPPAPPLPPPPPPLPGNWDFQAGRGRFFVRPGPSFSGNSWEIASFEG